MSTQNTYFTSSIIASQIIAMLDSFPMVFTAQKYSSSPMLRQLGAGPSFEHGETMTFKLAGYPVPYSSESVQIQSFSQRIISTSVSKPKWLKAVTYNINNSDQNLYINKKTIAETITAPSIRSLRDFWEVSGCREASQRCSVIPSFDSPINQEIKLPIQKSGSDTTGFNYKNVLWLQKICSELNFSKSYDLILNLEDQFRYSSSLTHVYNENMVGSNIKEGINANKRIAGFDLKSSNFIEKHVTMIPEGQPRGPLTIEQIDDTLTQRTIATLKNNSPSDITLRAGDIVYYKQAKSEQPLLRVKLSTKMPINDLRFSMCVTDDLYAASLGPNDRYSWDEAIYKIPAGKTAQVSVSNIPIGPSKTVNADNRHQNVSRNLMLSQDQFYVLEDHWKNLCISPSTFFFKSFKINPLHSLDSKLATGGKDGSINILVTNKGILREGYTRGIDIDFVSQTFFTGLGEYNMLLPSSVKNA